MEAMKRTAHPAIQAARQRSSVAGALHTELRREIVEAQLLPGQSLSENEIAARFGLSRTPVREAFIKLEEEGLVLVYPQYGTVVAPIRVSDVYDGQFVREAIECAALRVAVDRFTPKDKAALDAFLDVQRANLTGDPGPFFEADELLHSTLMKVAGHGRAWRVVEAAKGQHDRVRRLNVSNQLKRKSVLEEHIGILDRLAARDADGAVSAMQHHLRGVFRSVEAVLAQHPEFFVENEAQLPRPRRSSKSSRGQLVSTEEER
jgi:DNA-binding GntR family transcriptional regulator